MEITKSIRRSMNVGDLGYDHVSVDMQNDIINFNYRGESYRLIIEKVED